MQPRPESPRFRCRPTRGGGFAIVEAMMATMVFSMVMLGVYAALIQSYKMAALSRCREEARAVLRTYVDQFQRLQTTETVGGASFNRWLFNPTTAATGQGLVWGALNSDTVNNASTAVSSLPITLGATGTTVAAQLTRDVRYVTAATGAIATTRTIDSGGYMMQAVFTISYTISGRPYTQSVTALRVAP